MSAGAFAAGSFTWLVGVEDTCVYPADGARPPLDEHELTGHNDSWRADLTLARDLGATSLRYGVSWPLVHTQPDEFNWLLLDEVLAFAVDELGLTIVADLVHYGTPRWLPRSFADPGYPAAIEAFAGAFAERYKGKVTHFTPLNEPVTTASFCGLRGIWPPYLSDWEGWVSVAVPMAIGMARSIAAIRAAQPLATIVHVEAATLVSTNDPALDAHATLLRNVGWLPTDLLLGCVDRSHAMWGWLLDEGAAVADLEWLLVHYEVPDILGVNYYPDLSPRRLTSIDGAVAQVSHDRWSSGLAEAVRGFANRYFLPIVVTETSVEGDDRLREQWLHDSAKELLELRTEGLDIRGYTWWPLFDFVDWSWAAGGSNVEEFAVEQVDAGGTTLIAPAPPLGDPSEGKSAFLRRMGLVRLEERFDGTLERVVTPAAAEFTRLAEEQG